MTTKACISPGACGLQTTVTVRSEGSHCVIAIDSICAFVQSLADELTEVDPLREVLMPDDLPRIWQLAAKHRLHAGCPVPVGILKAIEVEAGVALPADVSITLSRE
jgi:hypothetical protein